MENLNSIGLNTEKSKELAVKLDILMSNYSIFYQNSRGLHWNIKGQLFFELHLKFEELYNSLFEKIDELAERVLTLGYTPTHNYTEYLKVSEIKESAKISDAATAIQEVLNSFKIILSKQREILHISTELEDEGTSALMSDYIREQEKLVWMYSSFLSK